MASPSLQFNNKNWNIFKFREDVLLLQKEDPVDIEEIQKIIEILENEFSDQIKDLVPAYNSITIFGLKEVDLRGLAFNAEVKTKTRNLVEIPVCYELGLDLEELASSKNLNKEELISIHLEPTYQLAMIGFTPGFIYLKGLNDLIYTPRKENPRVRIPSGSVGIGGTQTGIYSLEGPGGWNILGRTPAHYFQKDMDPPMQINIGDQVKFHRISEKEFEKWVS